MGQPTNVYSSYDASASTGVGRGNREDLADVVYDISPTQTPLLSALPRAKAEAVLHEWNTDKLADPAENAHIEGDDDEAEASIPKGRLNNRTVISKKVASVTGTQQVVSKTGQQDEMAYQMAKRTKEIKRDMELMLTANTAKAAGNDATARKSAGFPTWLKTNVNRGGGAGANPAGDGSDTATDGDQRAFVESLLLDVSQKCYVAGGNPSILLVGAFNKRAASGFSGNQNRNVDADDKKLVNSISVYEDDFNTLKIVPDRFSRARDALLIDTDYARVAYLRSFRTKNLAETGDSKQKELLAEWTLEMNNPDAHGIVADLTTS